jgi:hypothetical protein
MDCPIVDLIQGTLRFTGATMGTIHSKEVLVGGLIASALLSMSDVLLLRSCPKGANGSSLEGGR